MTDGIPASLRRLVIQRSLGVCEYCLIHQDDAHFTYQVDHIISRKHRGPTTSSNLALACLRCNVAKGSDVGAFVGRPPQLIRFFHPRKDRWVDHFRLRGVRIVPLTDIGEATVQLFDLNGSDRLLLRRALAKGRRYLSVAAQAYLQK